MSVVSKAKTTACLFCKEVTSYKSHTTHLLNKHTFDIFNPAKPDNLKNLNDEANRSSIVYKDPTKKILASYLMIDMPNSNQYGLALCCNRWFDISATHSKVCDHLRNPACKAKHDSAVKALQQRVAVKYAPKADTTNITINNTTNTTINNTIVVDTSGNLLKIVSNLVNRLDSAERERATTQKKLNRLVKKTATDEDEVMRWSDASSYYSDADVPSEPDEEYDRYVAFNPHKVFSKSRHYKTDYATLNLLLSRDMLKLRVKEHQLEELKQREKDRKELEEIAEQERLYIQDTLEATKAEEDFKKQKQKEYLEAVERDLAESKKRDEEFDSMTPEQMDAHLEKMRLQALKRMG